MNFLERDLEDIIFNTDQYHLRERGLHCLLYDSIYRQVNLGNYGILDILTIRKDNNNFYVTVYEMKQKQINTNSFLQAVRYVRGLQRMWDIYNLNNHELHLRIVLIGGSIDDKSDFCYISSVLRSVRFFTYKYDYDGISFESSNSYKLVDEKFPKETIISLKDCIVNLKKTIPNGPF